MTQAFKILSFVNCQVHSNGNTNQHLWDQYIKRNAYQVPRLFTTQLHKHSKWKDKNNNHVHNNNRSSHGNTMTIPFNAIQLIEFQLELQIRIPWLTFNSYLDVNKNANPFTIKLQIGLKIVLFLSAFKQMHLQKTSYDVPFLLLYYNYIDKSGHF